MAYQTKQQQAVLQCLQHRSEECLSAADLSEELRRSGLTVGLATVYRQLDNEEDIMILFRRYILMEGWSELAYQDRHSRSQVFQHHSDAVKRLDPKSPDETGLDRT